MDPQVTSLADSFLDQIANFSPVSATRMGDHRFDGRLDDVDDDTRADEARFCKQLLEDLHRLPGNGQPADDAVDASILEQHLRNRLWRLDDLQEWAWNPVIYTGIAGSSIYSLLARQFAPLQTRLGHVAERLEQFPRFLQQVQGTLDPKRVPAIHARTAIAQNPGVLTILDQMVAPHVGELSDGERARLEASMQTARQAIDEHQNWLENQLLPRCTGDHRLDAYLYTQKLQHALQSPADPAALHDDATRRLHALHDQMYDLAVEVLRQDAPGRQDSKYPSASVQRATIREALELACRDTVPKGEIVAAARHSLQMATQFVSDHDLISLPDSNLLEIIEMPEFERGVSLAYCNPAGPLDSGQRTFYAVCPPPTSWSDQQVESMLREYNTRSLHVLTIHEAMPGHFVQLAHANRCRRPLRAVLGSGVFIEGWATYTEWMMCEEGFLDHDPLMKLIVLKWYLRDVTNLLLDQAVHLHDVTDDDAMRLLQDDAFQEEREATGKVTRAQLTSAQTSTYYVGYKQMVELRRQAEQAWGSEFRLKHFHDRVLSFGSPPFPEVGKLLFAPGTAAPGSRDAPN